VSLNELWTEARIAEGPFVGTAAELIASEPGRRADREAELDRALLTWAARFAFVTISTLAHRWDVTEQRMRSRVRRLERAGYVQRVRRGANLPARIVVTERGGDLCGLTIRTARGREPLGHELAVIKRVMAIERHFAEAGTEGVRVLSERDMRRDERRDGRRRWAVDVVHPHGRRGRRWPDYTVATPDGTTAVELEFSLKAASRLRSIVRGYQETALYDFVDFVLLDRPQDVELRRCLTRLVDEAEAHSGSFAGIRLQMARIRIVSWRDPLPRLHAGIAPFPAIRRAAA
jgi:DNA-binding MarR family transcriptional regulator